MRCVSHVQHSFPIQWPIGLDKGTSKCMRYGFFSIWLQYDIYIHIPASHAPLIVFISACLLAFGFWWRCTRVWLSSERKSCVFYNVCPRVPVRPVGMLEAICCLSPVCSIDAVGRYTFCKYIYSTFASIIYTRMFSWAVAVEVYLLARGRTRRRA